VNLQDKPRDVMVLTAPMEDRDCVTCNGVIPSGDRFYAVAGGRHHGLHHWPECQPLWTPTVITGNGHSSLPLPFLYPVPSGSN
jgi:hypothetical protein